ncbi:Beta-barrel assembly-enhancing protease [Neolewinella maritima]|uniref:Beta-barrel assembly-enhancing protease n=1 Tax=Neolewinella maritima TaxID=1383882 RepID=A0ABM9B286_9BACT|nr:tetratricopeptide repeat protein [Neolewinella maritima]CAH1001469.1 Beta-barrel assembly-enhancing protease [Neolewinella maritima]
MLRYLLPLLLLGALACGPDPTTDPDPLTPGTDPAVAQLSELIEASPEDATLHAQRAQLYYERGNYPATIADLTRATELDSLTPGYAYALADAYLDSEQTERAVRVLEQTLRRHPQRLETRLRLGEAQLMQGRFPAAEATLTTALELEGPQAEAYYLLSQVYAEAGDTVQALAAAEQATRQDPEMTDAMLLLGELRAGQGDPAALAAFDEAVRRAPQDVIAVHARANYLYQSGDVQRALAEYRRVSSIDRQYVEGNFNAGLILLELDSLSQAYTEFNIAVRNDPVNMEAYLYRGYASEQLGDLAAARRDFETVLRMDPDFMPAQEALARLNG